jgi:arsenate reductase
LFVCTHNRCRSILCEAVARHRSGGRIAAWSAGSQPADAVHPDTLRHLAARGIDTTGLRSQSWDEFGNLEPDAVITVCDSAAGEACPLWMGSAVRVHWGLPDPSRVAGPGPERDAAFDAVIARIERYIDAVLSLDRGALDGAALRAVLQQIAGEAD